MKQTTYKKLLSISIASALGLTTIGDVSADAISTMALQDIDADNAVSGFRFTTNFDTTFPTGIPGTFPGDLTFGGANDDCGGGAGSCTDLQFAIGEIVSNVFTSGFNFGGGGDFQPFISTDSVNGPGGGVGNATGAITIQENGVRQLDLTALDFGGLYNGTNFLLAPKDLEDATGNSSDAGLPIFPSDGAFTGVSSTGIPYYVDAFTPTGGNFDIIIRWTSPIDQGSSFDGQVARWRLEGTLAVTDEAPTVFISGAGGVGGNFTSNVNAGIDPYIDSGAVCQDVVDGAIAPLTDVASLPGTLLPNTFLRTTDLVGTSTGADGTQFTVTYTCTDSQSQTTTAVRMVDVGDDLLPPVITLGIGAPESGRVESGAGSIVDILVGIPYIDASASCTDNRDGGIPFGANFTVGPTDPVVIDTSVASVGNIISFSCNDVANNGPTVVDRTVNVIKDEIKPVIILASPGPINIVVGAPNTNIVPMVAPAVICEDTNELNSTPADITNQINVNPTTVDTSVAGTTTITYTCMDAGGNSADPVDLEINVLAGGLNFNIISMTVEDVLGADGLPGTDRIAGCFNFEPDNKLLDPVTCDGAPRFAGDSSTIDTFSAEPTTVPGVATDLDENGKPIGIRFGVYQELGAISPGFIFAGFPFVPLTFDPPTEQADPPKGFVTVAGDTSILTLQDFPFSGLFSSDKPNTFFLDPDAGTLATLVMMDNNDDDGITRTFNYLIKWTHYITTAEDPTASYDDNTAAWRLEGVITVGSPPIVINNPPQITSLTAAQGALAITRIVTGADGNVTATVAATDPNGDNLSFDWSATPVTPVGPTNVATFSFDPATLSDGLVTLKVTVTDDSAGEQLSTSTELDLQVSNGLVLSVDDDANGNGIDDATEGFGDSDDDGIPEYRDATNGTDSLSNRRSFGDAAEGDIVVSAGRLRLGSVAFGTGNDSFIVSEEDIGAEDSRNKVPGLEHSGGGIADFEVVDLPLGGAVSVVIPQSVPLPNTPIYRKYVDSKGWFTFAALSGNRLASASRVAGVCPGPADTAYDAPVDSSGNTMLVEGDDCIRVTIVDGSTMDGDAITNGIVLDPGTIASNGAVPVGKADKSIYDGGCTITPTAHFRNHLEWLLVGLFLLGMGYRTRKSGDNV